MQSLRFRIRSVSPTLLGLGIFATLHFLKAWIQPWLMEGAAKLSALYLGVQTDFHDSAWWISAPHPVLKISESCSGFGFFTMLTSLMIWLALTELPPNKRFKISLLILISTLPLTLLLNSARILLSSFLYRMTVPSLGSIWGDRFHLLAGVLTFLPALILVFSLAKWRWCDARPN